MGWLRSRWTVVALVPAFFLTGFGIVSALEGGSDDAGPSVLHSTSEEGAAPGTVTMIQGTEPEGPGGEATTDAGDGGVGGGARSGPTGDGGGSGEAPPAPRSGVIVVEYGRWDGLFRLADPVIVLDFGVASVVGELHYLGGVGCSVGLVRMRAWFYNEGGRLVGDTVWESVQSTGEGVEVTRREPLRLEAYGQISEAPASASLRFTAVECV